MLHTKHLLMSMNIDYGGVRSRQEEPSIKLNVPVDSKYFERSLFLPT